MERRVFLAILLSFAVFYGYQRFFAPPPPARQPASTPAPAAPAATTTPAPASAVAPVAPAGPAEPLPTALVAETTEREIVVETAVVQAVLSNRGGRLLHWRLKAHRDTSGRPVDLVPSGLPASDPRPFQLQVDDEQVTKRMNEVLYRVTGDSGGKVDATSSAASVAFEYQDASGLHVQKSFVFEPGKYVVEFAPRVMRGTERLKATILWGPGLGDLGASRAGGSFFTGNYVQPPQGIYDQAGDVTRMKSAALTSKPRYEGEFQFIGIDDHYFLAAAVNPGRVASEFRASSLPAAGGERQFISHSLRLATGTEKVKFFIGPKQVDVLRDVDGELVRAIHFGMFDWLVVPLLSSLTWLYGFVGNYGVSIIVLTLLINLAMFPLRHKSVVAMRKMQQIQPQIKAVQERYSHLKVTDPARQKMNTEVMNLYREKGVNPASGCIPMLLTMPVLLAFYSLLSMSIELRGAPFFGWIHDLSTPDPYYVMPALMGVTMFWQQKVTPTTVDPAQQRIMMIMPVMFTAMMIFSPSGVVLYWFVSNLWAIGQQYFTTWLIGPPVVAGRPAAERRLKSAGSGKTAGANKG